MCCIYILFKSDNALQYAWFRNDVLQRHSVCVWFRDDNVLQMIQQSLEEQQKRVDSLQNMVVVVDDSSADSRGTSHVKSYIYSRGTGVMYSLGLHL